MKLLLRRNPPTDDGVFGRLFIPGIGNLKTMEDDELGAAQYKAVE